MTSLYIVPTPIGNLKDITYRAIEVLKNVDLILAEDTRNSIKLLKYYEIKTSCESFHMHNEHSKLNYFIDKIKSGKVLALISDAGTPGISDPGYLLIREVISNNYLIPTVEKLLNFEKDNINFEEGVIEYIIEKFTKQEKGVRNLKRCIEIVFTKINLYRLMKPGSKLFSQEIISDIQFPFTVTKEHIDKLIKLDSGNKDNVSHMAMYL